MRADSEPTEEERRSLFEFLGKHPGPWWLSSLRLKEAADVLRSHCWPEKRKYHDIDAALADFYIGPVYMLLMGMAIEAALKTILVAKDPALVGKEKIPQTIGNHHLKKLWNLAGVDRVRSRQRDSLLERLEICLVVFGRYPVSKKADGMAQMWKSIFQGELHFDQITRLWASLEKHMRKINPELFN